MKIIPSPQVMNAQKVKNEILGSGVVGWSENGINELS